MRSALLVLFALTVVPPALGDDAPSPAFRVVHVHVALCDNEHQGIVPVGKVLGDGKDPEHNLYWGAGYGVKTFFARSSEWTELTVSTPPKAPVLRRAVFLSKKLATPVIVVADAYDGERIDTALKDFAVKAPTLTPGDRHPSGAIVLACMSQKFFTPPLRAAGTEALLTTTNFMAPEAYTLDAAIRSWGSGGTAAQTRIAAGKAYAQYQKISDGSGIGLFANGYAK